MIVLASVALGALVGGFRAIRREGNAKDIAQYAAVYAMAFGVLAIFAAVLIERAYSP
ncbi:MAG: apolipoprotein acyltransferase [Rhodobacter sp.]|nr:apolipoprotein acyltransferase [Rhodobacter sp.]MCY4169589.1 apolipoprotein acyltransferase [Rhodobacter sp.]MCY4240522.1 apolipoprotein acyltransferase [Rhodobacter sp.]